MSEKYNKMRDVCSSFSDPSSTKVDVKIGHVLVFFPPNSLLFVCFFSLHGANINSFLIESVSEQCNVL